MGPLVNEALWLSTMANPALLPTCVEQYIKFDEYNTILLLLKTKH